MVVFKEYMNVLRIHNMVVFGHFSVLRITTVTMASLIGRK
jgi:hypothetical protein